MTLRVGVNARTFSESEPGGAVQAAMKMTHALAQQADTEVILFGHESIGSNFDQLRVVSDLCRWESQEFGVVWERLILPSLARREAVDVLFCPNGNAPLTEQPFRVVTCIHDVNAMKRFSGGVHQVYRGATIPRVARLSDHLVTVSEFSKAEITNELGIPPEKISVVYNGVDELYHTDGGGTPIDIPDPYVLYVGSLNPRKNISRAIEAFQEFIENNESEHRFVLIGPGNKRVFDSLNVPENDRIVTPGFLSQSKLKYVYTQADMFLYPSLYEGFGLPPLEAMACGTPVVVSDAASIPEVVGEAGEFVDPFNVADIARGLMRVSNNDVYRDHLVKKGKERVERFTWKNTGEHLRKVL